MLKKKSLDEINDRIADVIHKFAVQSKVKFLGSNSYKGLLYASDFDIVSVITEPAEALANHFKKLFSKPLGVYLMDFKAGLKDGEKLRWNKRQLAQGMNQGVSLADAIKMDTLVKLDLIVPVGDSFAEVSEIYETKYQTKKTKKQIEKELEEDITMYAKDNSMKALKRMYSLISLETGRTKMKKKLIDFFNSDVGLVNKVANDLELLEALTNKYTIPKKKIEATKQMLKQRLAVVPWIDATEFSIASLRKKVNLASKVLLHEFR